MFAIRPSRDIRNNYAEISKLAQEAPVAITVNGKEDTVIMSHEDYVAQQAIIQELKERLEVYSILAQAEDDVKLGRIHSEEDCFATVFSAVKGAL